jgi:hypothetical protein
MNGEIKPEFESGFACRSLLAGLFGFLAMACAKFSSVDQLWIYQLVDTSQGLSKGDKGNLILCLRFIFLTTIPIFHILMKHHILKSTATIGHANTAQLSIITAVILSFMFEVSILESTFNQYELLGLCLIMFGIRK